MRYSDLLAIVYRPAGRGVGGQHVVGRLHVLRSIRRQLACIPRQPPGAGLSQEPFQSRGPDQHGQCELRTQFSSARHLVRSRVHRRGCRFVQARPAKLRLHAFPARARRIRQIRHSSCRRKPVSRPCPSASKRPRDLLDPPSLRQAGFRRNHADCDRPRIRFPFRKHGRIRRHPSSGDRCRHLNSDADSAARCGLAAARIQNFRRERPSRFNADLSGCCSRIPSEKRICPGAQASQPESVSTGNDCPETGRQDSRLTLSSADRCDIWSSRKSNAIPPRLTYEIPAECIPTERPDSTGFQEHSRHAQIVRMKRHGGIFECSNH